MSGERVSVQGAGRTDAGVHALGSRPFRPGQREAAETVRSALNFHLSPIQSRSSRRRSCRPISTRVFSATGRRYRYLILNRRAPPAIDRGRVWHVPVPLDTVAMADAASVLQGHHDFNSFRSTSCQSPTSIKTLDLFDVTRLGDEIRIDVGSRSFLHNQVRILVGTLALVGRGQWTRRDVEDALAARDRTRAGPDRAAARPLPDGSALRPSRRRRSGRHRDSDRRGMTRKATAPIDDQQDDGDRPARAERHPGRHQEPVEEQRPQGRDR